MLNFSNNYAPSLLEQRLVRPVWIQLGEFVGYSVVLAMPDRVYHSELWMRVYAIIAWPIKSIYMKFEIYNKWNMINI